MFRYSRPHLHGALSEHHQLSVWVTSTLGLSKLAAQFYFYNFEIVLIPFGSRPVYDDILQAPMGNLHLMCTVAALLSYFSRRPGLMRLVGRMVTLATLVSLGLAGLAAGQRGNIWVVAGTGVMALAASWTRS